MHMYNWNKSGTECDCMFYCSDDFMDPVERKTLEDMDYFIVTKFGQYIIKENITPQKAAKNMRFYDDYQINSIVDGNPALNRLMPGSQKTSYKRDYPLVVDRKQLNNINQSLRDQFHKLMDDKKIDAKKVAPGKYEVRVGQW